MSAGDVCLLGLVAYAIASDPEVPPNDGQALYSEGGDVARLGGDEIIAIGGTVTFDPGNSDFLLDMLPDFLFVPRSAAASGTIATILGLMNDEIERDIIGSEIVSARLADVLLVEAIRAYAGSIEQLEIGWLGVLSDPRLGRVLRVIHGAVAQQWTVAQLAGVAGMSRAAFSAEFTRRVGKPPLAYVRAWRLTIARAALTQGDETVASIARKVGYTSQCAFGHAFRSIFGSAPKAHVQS
jgi:transcriptional regulator GlxA family with amidase domain